MKRRTKPGPECLVLPRLSKWKRTRMNHILLAHLAAWWRRVFA